MWINTYYNDDKIEILIKNRSNLSLKKYSMKNPILLI